MGLATPQTDRVTNLDELILEVPFDGTQILDASVPAAALAANAGGLTKGQIDHTFFLAGDQTVANGVAAFLAGKAETVTDIRAYAGTAPVGSTMIIDVKKNGTTMFTTSANKPTIADGGHASTTTAPDVTSIAAGDRITVDVDQIGSGTAGADLYVTITTTGALT